MLWSQKSPAPTGSFDWRTAVWHLRAPVLRALFQQLSDPGRLLSLGLVEVLNWTAAALDRVDQQAFFARFDEGEAVPYFYEPFLQAFDPELRKQLGVWYTPLEEERDRAERVKQETPILVILGNPPYNGFAGVAVDEERTLSEAYRTTKRVRRPEGHGLNDLYVRFFRMAERRIAGKTGQGVVCFISNYSWLDGLSFTGMRERYLEAFDEIRIDCLNGDKYRTGKVAPDGSSDPSIFSTEGDPVGIQVGTAITTLVRKDDHTPAERVGIRHLWGQAKREELVATADGEAAVLYDGVAPVLLLGLPFGRTAVSERWFDWPALPDLFPASFRGVVTSRDSFLVDADLDRLRSRIQEYFETSLSDDEITRRYPRVMKNTGRFNAREVRGELLRRGGPSETGFSSFSYRPFDDRWLYWGSATKLLDEKRADYRPHVFPENLWLVTPQKQRREWSPPSVTRKLGDINFMDGSTAYIPLWLRDDGIGSGDSGERRSNLAAKAEQYLDRLGASAHDLLQHVLATLHDPAYREANAGALRMGWPRIPLPGWPDGEAEGATEELARSAARGRTLAALLDPDMAVGGVTAGKLRSEFVTIAVPATKDGRNMTDEDFSLTTGWGHFGAGDAVMPGQGRTETRAFTADERSVLGEALGAFGENTVDVYLNAQAFWRNIPAAVWEYKLGGYQVLKKWLSYRERSVLGRALSLEEVQHFMNTARRIAAILLEVSAGDSRAGR